ncbi:hypothetical protein AB3662_12110 [Sorangium cellulosum]|uniref:hypothetical protein n=1 Tax=Sorangium cellulosum TaxID=56 RepID=UPI003D9A3DDE
MTRALAALERLAGTGYDDAEKLRSARCFASPKADALSTMLAAIAANAAAPVPRRRLRD